MSVSSFCISAEAVRPVVRWTGTRPSSSDSSPCARMPTWPTNARSRSSTTRDDNTLLYVDSVLGQAIHTLDASGVPYVFIYLSDHGESLLENGMMFHGVPPGVDLPPEQADIPLIVKSSVPLDNRTACAVSARGRVRLRAGFAFHRVAAVRPRREFRQAERRRRRSKIAPTTAQLQLDDGDSPDPDEPHPTLVRRQFRQHAPGNEEHAEIQRGRTRAGIRGRALDHASGVEAADSDGLFDARVELFLTEVSPRLSRRMRVQLGAAYPQP